MPTDHLDKKSRLAKNTLFSVIAWFFPVIVGFVTTPILVTELGVEQYGIFAVILGFLSYSFTFGTGKVVAKYIPEYQVTDESGKISDVISATLWFSLFVALTGAVVVALLTNTIVTEVLLIPTGSTEIATKAFYIACVTGVVMMTTQTFQYVLQGLHRFGSYVVLTNLNGLLLGGGNVILVLNGFGVVALMLWSLCVAGILGLMFYFRARQSLPNAAIKTVIDRSILRSVIKYGGNIILFQIFANLLYVFERAWVTRQFGPKALTYYAVPMLLAVYMHGVLASFVQVLFPSFNELLNQRDKLIDIYKKGTKFVIAVVAFISLTYICAGKMFLTLWVNEEFAVNSYALLVIHVLTFALIAIAIISFQIAETFKFARLTVIITFTWMAVAIPLMIVTAGPWKSEGIALSRLAVVLITFPLVFYVEKAFLGGVFWHFWLTSLLRVGLASMLFAVVGYQIFNRFAYSWFTLIFGTLICGVLFAGILFLAGFLTSDEKALIRDFLNRMRRDQ
mgnify:FL=1